MTYRKTCFGAALALLALAVSACGGSTGKGGSSPSSSVIQTMQPQALRQIGLAARRHLVRGLLHGGAQGRTLPGQHVGQAGIAKGNPDHAPSLMRMSIMSCTAWITFALAA